MQDPILRLVNETPVSNVRNFCILAHVDHGKSTVADHLLTTNGLLSAQLAGQVRYLDSRPDEQERLITMKASSVALLHRLQPQPIQAADALLAASAAAFAKKQQAEREVKEAAGETIDEEEYADALPSATSNVAPGNYVANLLDCPGHIDFSSEVAAAVRLCDGAVVVVDLVDGVTMVTRAMLRQCYLEGLPMVLLLNKLDSIILRMQLTPEEGFARMLQAVSECNAFVASCVAAEDIARAGATGDDDDENAEDDAEGGGGNGGSDDDDEDVAIAEEYRKAAEAKKAGAAAAAAAASRAVKRGAGGGLRVPPDEVWFCPTKGNVLFASGLHGFGFQLHDFAALYKAKIPFLTTTELTRGMWGQHFVDPRTKTVVDQARKEGTPPLGVQLFCEPLWQLHLAFFAVGPDLDQEKITTMLGKIGATVKPSFFTTSAQAKQAAMNRYGMDGMHLPKLFTFLGEWMPLNVALLDAICCQLPCPRESQARRAPLLLPSAAVLASSSLQHHAHDDAALRAAANRVRAATAVLAACDRAEDAPMYAYVAKLFDVQYLAGVLPPPTEVEVGHNNHSSSSSSAAAASASAQAAAAEMEGFDLDNHFVALTRIFSGRIRRGDAICVESSGHGAVAGTVTDVYILRGQGLESVPYAAAGTVCAVRGVSKSIVKCGTLCGLATASRSASSGAVDELLDATPADAATAAAVQPRLPFLVPIRLMSSSVVQLAVTPEQPEHLAILMRGLKLLHQTDPQVEIAVLPSGDHVVRCAGEVHAERCIEDLRTTFARVDLRVSDPIVGMRETISRVYKINSSGAGASVAGDGSVTAAASGAGAAATSGGGAAAAANAASTAGAAAFTDVEANYDNVVSVQLNQFISVQLAMLSLPSDVVEMLLTNATEDSGSAPETARRVVAMLRNPALVERRRAAWKTLFRPVLPGSKNLQRARIVAWGPNKMNFCGNVLLDLTGLFPALDESALCSEAAPSVIQEALMGGFELGVSRGPMADEPMFGVAVAIVAFHIHPSANVAEAVTQHLQAQGVQLSPQQFAEYVRQVEQNEVRNFLQSGHASAGTSTANAFGGGVLTGHIVSSVATACRTVFGACAGRQRVVEPVYECIVYSAGQTRGKIYTTLHRRRAQIVEEVLQEGSDMYSIRSRIPATESFGLQDELRTATSGAATAQLRMERWEVLDIDPYFKPRTREQIEELGDTVDKPNLAMTIIEGVRKRKGLFRQQAVKHAEKQKFSIRGG